MIDDDDTWKGDDFQIPVPSILKHGNYVSDDEDLDDEVSNSDEFQESAIQVDLEGYNAVADKNEFIVQPRSETKSKKESEGIFQT